MDENDIIIKMSTAGGYMKFLFAPDSFKGTMSAININRLLRHATHRGFGSVEYIDVTMADGGEGFRVIIMTQANSQVNTRVLELLPKFKIKKMNCAV